MNVREPRFLVVDLHKNKAVLATTDEMQALLWREESNKKSDMKEDSSYLPARDYEFTSRT